MTDSSGSYSYIYDGKGNVVALVDSTGTDSAKYRYDEFGVLVAQSGALDQPYRFSTKPFYSGYGFYYFGYRFYLAHLGRWMTQDPMGENGGLNLYKFAGNSAVNVVDPLGLEEAPWYVKAYLPGYSWPYSSIFKYIHYNRNIFNETVSYNVAYLKWIRLKKWQSVLHNMGISKCEGDNEKYISPDGHSELVFDSSGNLVTDPLNEGSLNIISPNDSELGHTLVDVLPYLIWGNSPNDPSTFWQRIDTSINGLILKYTSGL